MSDQYQERLDAHSHAHRHDPLRDAAHRAVTAWMAEDDLEKNDLSEEFWKAMADLAAVLVERKRGEPEEVEVTSRGSSELVSAHERPVERRRSGARNQSAQVYQNAFAEEARVSMGQPDVAEAKRYLDKRVRLIFNVDWHPAEGVLTYVDDDATPYLILDNYRERVYPLHAVQSIKEVP